jgi:hypothetical protein
MTLYVRLIFGPQGETLSAAELTCATDAQALKDAAAAVVRLEQACGYELWRDGVRIASYFTAQPPCDRPPDFPIRPDIWGPARRH